MTMNAEYVLYTPERANEILKNQVRNRKLNKTLVIKYANDMKNGKWQVNGEFIKFNSEGRLVDGQHRLAAIILCGKSFSLSTLYNIDADIMDCGKSRSQNDLYNFRYNESIGKPEITLANMLMRIQNRVPSMMLSNDDVIELAHKYKGLFRLATNISKSTKTSSTTFVRHTQKGIFHLLVLSLLADGYDEQDIRDYIKVVNTGLPVDTRSTSNSALIITRMISNDVGFYRATKDFTKRCSYIETNFCKHTISLLYQSFVDFVANLQETKDYKNGRMYNIPEDSFLSALISQDKDLWMSKLCEAERRMCVFED